MHSKGDLPAPTGYVLPHPASIALIRRIPVITEASPPSFANAAACSDRRRDDPSHTALLLTALVQPLASVIRHNASIVLDSIVHILALFDIGCVI